jgi:uncharacterized protein YkwD
MDQRAVRVCLLASVVGVLGVLPVVSAVQAEGLQVSAKSASAVTCRRVQGTRVVNGVRKPQWERRVFVGRTACPRGWQRVPTRPTTTPSTAVPSTTSSPTTLPPSTFDASAFEGEILRLTNVERTTAGLAPLASCARLATAARAHSERMLAGQFFEHVDPGTGSTISARIAATGYMAGASSWRVGENIAMGYATAAATMNGWMNSAGHRANILEPSFTHLGVGVTIGVWEAWRGRYGNWNTATFSTQNFGAGGNC